MLWQIFIYIRSKRTIGKNIPFEYFDNELINKIKGKSGMIYFFSPTCYNCKKQTPIIEKVKKEYDNIISVDVSKSVGIAKIFNIAATPSMVFFTGNKIQDFHVGVKKESVIIEKLKKLC